MTEFSAFVLRVALLAAAITGLAVLLGGNRDARPRVLAARDTDDWPPARIDRTRLSPIDAEARVFATRVDERATEPVRRRNSAHPRTLSTFRGLRAFPGAPPRIPHGLTAEEFRTTRCRTCHERGGYSMRFEAYAPITPHPQLEDCLQCHLATDAVVGVRLPAGSPDGLCRQCHAPGVAVQARHELDWSAASWPTIAQPGAGDTPPVIPHDVTMRSDCLTCHAGPGAVAEIRTTHADRANCRQCHLLDSGEGEYQRSRGVQ